MILTLTPNPSLDLLFSAERLVWEDANRVAAPRRRPGGQGINLVRAARELGGAAAAVAPLGGPVGEELAKALHDEGTPLRSVAIAGETRIFVGVREAARGRSLLLNPRGPALTPAEVATLAAATVSALDELRPHWLACCGSLPPGTPPDFYAGVGREARARGVRFVPDCDGHALRLAAEAGCDLLVPNRHEAERLLGRDLPSVDDAGRAARELLAFGAAAVCVTLGDAGAVLATGAGLWHARPPRLDTGSAVGAGDAFLAALLLRLERDGPESALVAAVAAGSAVLRSVGSSILDAGVASSFAARVHIARIGESG
jgi:1-phosphofructokinase family hexose kinase